MKTKQLKSSNAQLALAVDTLVFAAIDYAFLARTVGMGGGDLKAVCDAQDKLIAAREALANVALK